MKKILLIVVVTVLLLAGVAIALDVSKGSGSQTASATISSVAGTFSGIMIATDGTNAVTLDVYDNTAASGTKLIPTTPITTSAIDRVQIIRPPVPVRYQTVLYVNVSVAGAGTCAYVAYFY